MLWDVDMRTMPNRMSIPLALSLVVLVGACAGSGDGLTDGGDPNLPTYVHGRITDKTLKPMGPGLMFVEWGKVWSGAFQWHTAVDEDGYFEAKIPTGGLENPEYGFHWYFEGYIYIATPMFLHPGDDNDINVVKYENAPATDLVGIPPLPESRGGLVIAPLVDDNLKDNPVITNPKITPNGKDPEGNYLVKAEIDAMSPKNNLSEQILVGTQFGQGTKMNPPSAVIDGNYPNGHYSVTLSVPPTAPETVQFRFVADDHDCNNSPPMYVNARVR